MNGHRINRHSGPSPGWEKNQGQPSCVCPLHSDDHQIFVTQIVPWGLDPYSKLLVGNGFSDVCRHPNCPDFKVKTFSIPASAAPHPAPPDFPRVIPVSPDGTAFPPLSPCQKPGSHPRPPLSLASHIQSLTPSCLFVPWILMSHNLSSSLHTHGRRSSSSSHHLSQKRATSPASLLPSPPHCCQNQSRKANQVTPQPQPPNFRIANPSLQDEILFFMSCKICSLCISTAPVKAWAAATLNSPASVQSISVELIKK